MKHGFAFYHRCVKVHQAFAYLKVLNSATEIHQFGATKLILLVKSGHIPSIATEIFSVR